MTDRLKGKVAIVTGGGVGIGAAITKAYVEEGAKVLITGRREQVLKDFAATFPEGTVAVCPGDISVEENAKAMVDAAVEFGGRLDILVNNAAIDPPGTIVDIPVDTWMSVINTNIHGTFFMSRFAIPEMIKNGKGSIVNISSLAGVRNIPAMPAYSTTKSGMIGMSNAIALDYGPMGIRSNTICPGATNTAMMQNAMSALAEAQGTDAQGAIKLLTRFCPIPRACEPDEIAVAAVFVGSDESSYMTGATLMLDGGASIVDPCGSSTASLGTKWGGAE